MISEDTREVLTFFTFSCSGCHSGLLAMSHAENKVEGYYRAVPLVSSDTNTHKSAALYFLMKLTQPLHELSDAEIFDVGFQLYPKVKDEPMSPDVYLMLFREHGMEVDVMEFLKAWEAAHVMMGSAKELTSQLTEEKSEFTMPVFRITHNDTTRFWSPDFNNITLSEFTTIISEFEGG